MTRYFCDVCNKEIDKIEIISVQADRTGDLNTETRFIHREFEICDECFKRAFKSRKSEYEFPPQTVEAISGVSPV